jgi:hypothetical protein
MPNIKTTWLSTEATTKSLTTVGEFGNSSKYKNDNYNQASIDYKQPLNTLNGNKTFLYRKQTATTTS